MLGASTSASRVSVSLRPWRMAVDTTLGSISPSPVLDMPHADIPASTRGITATTLLSSLPRAGYSGSQCSSRSLSSAWQCEFRPSLHLAQVIRSRMDGPKPECSRAEILLAECKYGCSRPSFRAGASGTRCNEIEYYVAKSRLSYMSTSMSTFTINHTNGIHELTLTVVQRRT